MTPDSYLEFLKAVAEICRQPGTYTIPASDVRKIGGGSIEVGSAILDKFVESVNNSGV